MNDLKKYGLLALLLSIISGVNIYSSMNKKVIDYDTKFELLNWRDEATSIKLEDGQVAKSKFSDGTYCIKYQGRSGYYTECIDTN